MRDAAHTPLRLLRRSMVRNYGDPGIVAETGVSETAVAVKQGFDRTPAYSSRTA